MPKFLVVKRTQNNVSTSVHAELMDAILEVNKIFEDGTSASVKPNKDAFKPNVMEREQISTVLTMHNSNRDAIVFRVPNLVSYQLRFSVVNGLNLLSSKKLRWPPSEVSAKKDGDSWVVNV